MNGQKSDEAFHFSPRPNRASEINWFHWGIEPFERAQRDGKLIILSISASWCHWCHVMDETTYSDPDVIRKINENFVAIRVDSDRRPDINRRYNQGGWPTTAFLLPSGAAIAGLTYAPPQYFSALLDKLSALYKSRREEIEVCSVIVEEETKSFLDAFKCGGKITDEISDWMASVIEKDADPDFGGLGLEPKFPPTGALEFSIARLERQKDDRLQRFVVATLNAIRLGGLFDEVEGGFFRYSTVRDWSKPHYEKMLEDNAELLRIYLSASRLLGNPEYEQTARRVIEYCLDKLYLKDVPGFSGSQDADEEYYLKSFEGRKALSAPAVDETLFVDANSLMISALSYASVVLNMPFLLDRAMEIADFIWSNGFHPSKGLCHYFPPITRSPKMWGEARDQVFYLKALVDLYQITGLRKFFERALQLGGLLRDLFLTEHGWIGEASSVKREEESGNDKFDEGLGKAEEKLKGEPHENGPCLNSCARGNLLSCLPVDAPDMKVNGIAIIALGALDWLVPVELTQNEGYGFENTAYGIADSLKGAYERFSHFAAWYVMGVHNLIKGRIEVRISPEAGPDEASELIKRFIQVFDLATVIRRERVDDFIETDSKTRRPLAVICAPGRCVPVFSISETEKIMESLRTD